jgi:hypothetical protein
MARFNRLREGWLMVGLVALMLFSVVWSIQRAGWSDDLFILTPIALLGMATALALCKLRGVPRSLLHLTGVMAGIALVLWETSSLLDDPRLVTVQDRVQDLLGRGVIWVQTIMDGGASDDLPLFILSLAVLTWALAYASTWFIFRSRWLWWALLLNGGALIINLSYSSAALHWYFVLFMLVALLLMVRFNMLLHEERWERERVNYSPSLRWNFLRASSLFAVIVAGLMWYMPTQAVNRTLSDAWNQVNGPWEDLQGRWSKAFAGVPGSGNFGYATFNDSFALGGSLNLGNGVALLVHADRPLYWRAKTYDTWTGRGWKSTAQDTFTGRNVSPRLSLDPSQQLPTSDTLRLPVTATIQLMRPSDNVLFVPLRPSRISVATRLSVSWQVLSDVYAVPGSEPRTAPIEVQPLLSLFADARREALQVYGRDPRNPDVGGAPLPEGGAEAVARLVLSRTSQETAIGAQIDQLRDRGISASYWLGKDFTFMVRASGPIPVYDDLTAVYAADRMQPNQAYTVESEVSNADKQSLRQEGGAYPQWVRDRYLQIPRSLPARVIEKAHEVVDQAGATNAYDMAIALQDYLRTFKYTTHVTLPPAGRDSVDYFLFDSQEGYCEYYSSAMVVMLRALGIPAREATGYAPGDYDSATQQWTVRESSSHAWPEVYFPNVGWQQFEPTPSQSVLDRPDTQEAAMASPTPFVPLTPAAQITRLNRADAEESPTPFGGVAGSLDPNGGGGPNGWLVLLGALALLASGLLARAWSEKRAIASGRLVLGGIQYYERLLRLAWWLGLRSRPSDTPYEFADQVGREVPGAQAYVAPIARAYVRERYGQHRPDAREQQDLARAWAALRARMLRRLSDAQRWVARR